MLTQQGTITGPQDSCTDIDYAGYDNGLWLVCNAHKIMYKLSTSGSVLHQFSLTEAYPIGATENAAAHTLYLSDRRSARAAVRSTAVGRATRLRC